MFRVNSNLIHNLCNLQKIQIRGMKKKQESKSRAKRKETQMLTLKSLTPSPQRVAPPQRVDFWIRKHPPPKELRPPKELIFGSGNTHPQRVATGDTIKKMRLHHNNDYITFSQNLLTFC